MCVLRHVLVYFRPVELCTWALYYRSNLINNTQWIYKNAPAGYAVAAGSARGSGITECTRPTVYPRRHRPDRPKRTRRSRTFVLEKFAGL